MKKIFSVIVAFSMVFSLSGPVFAANGTWLNTGVTSASWVNADNWSAGAVPGATAGTVNTDVATFNTAVGANNYGTSATPIIIDPSRNIGGISFDTAAGNYVIGSTGLNPLLLTSGGTITILNTLTSTNATETINAPLVIEGAAGTYTFSNNSANGAGAGAGTLNIGGGITGGAAGATVLTLSGSNTNSNTISGIIANGTATSVGVSKSGTGTWDISGTNTYTGGTTISAGTLQVSNASALGTGAVSNSAALAIGTTNLTLGNTYTQNTGSALDLSANSSSSFGSITSTGHAAVVSATSTVNVAVGGYIANKSTLEIINTGGSGVSNAPNVVTTSESGTSTYSPRVSFTSSILNGNLILTADHSTSGFASLANHANARAAGGVLDNETNPSSDMNNVLNTLEFLSNGQTTAALNTLDPIVDRGILDASTAGLNNFIGASLDRVQNVGSSTGVSSGDDSKYNGIWAKQYGSYLDQGTRDGIQGYNAWNTGTAVGLDHMFDDLTIGASLGYAYGVVNSDANNANTDINSAQATIYTGYQGTNIPVYVDLAGYFAHNWYQGQRDINVGPISRTADSNYGGQQFGAYLEGGYKIDVGDSLQITPLASLQWTHLSFGSYNETDASSLDLMVNRQSYNILESGLGASIAYPVKYGWGEFTPEVHAKWLYDFIDDDMVVTSTYTGGGASFTSTGASPARDGANIGGKLSFDFKNDISIIAGVDTEIKDNFFGVAGTVTVRYRF